MLGEKIENSDVKVWLVNTGWSGGAYGTGERMSLKYTRAMITSALEGDLDHSNYEVDEVFGLNMPKECPNVPDKLLNPKNTWEDRVAFERKANELAQSFIRNFAKYEENTSLEILSAQPKVLVK